MYPATPRLILLKFVYIIAFVFGALSVAQANDSSDNKPTPVEIEKIMTKARALIDEGELKKATRQLNKVVAHDKKMLTPGTSLVTRGASSIKPVNLKKPMRVR